MFDRILVIGAHTDDIEIMCGGTISKFIELGCEVYYSTFSYADKSLPKGFSKGITKTELKDATTILGIPFENLFLFDYEARVFPSIRQDILENLIVLRKDIKPDLVITHNSNDTHQDHKVISEETFRAFKQNSSIWGGESLKNDRRFNNNLYIKLNKSHIEKKIEAILQFKSQIIKFDNRNILEGLATYRGLQVKNSYAECFEATRIIL